MKKRNKNAKIIINDTELVPTTIGALDTKEGGIFFVIVIFALLVVVVFFLPQINQYYLQLTGQVDNVTPVPNTPSDIVEPTPPSSDDTNYINLLTTNTYQQDNITYEFSLNQNAKQLDLSITKTDMVMNNYFETNPTYLELYSEEKKLLDRLKISKANISTTTKYNYDLTNAYNTGQVSYLVIKKMTTFDYPVIDLYKDEETNKISLVCNKDNETLTYYFDEKEYTYQLLSLTDRIVVSDNTDESVNKYEELKDSYNNVDGITAEIVSASNGFTFEASINLDKVNLKTKKNLLSNIAFYEKNTEAKTISFELQAQGFTCKSGNK